jgi:hypothetical protein
MKRAETACVGRTRQVHPRATRLIAVVFVFSAAMPILLLTSAQPAFAACGTHILNTAYQASANGRGERVSNPGMGVYDGAVTCSRISSLILCGNAMCTNYVEVGWYEDVGVGYACLDSTGGPVKELAFALKGNTIGCLHNPSSISEGTDGFTMNDENQDGVWHFQHSTVGIWNSPDLGNFNSGSLFTNAERGDTTNTPHADFDGLGREDDSNNWSAWQNTSFSNSMSDDDGAHGCKYSDSHVAVKLDGTPC